MPDSSSDGDRPDRRGTRLFSFHIDEEIFYAVKLAAVRNRATTAVAGHEMIALYLKDKGEPVPPKLLRKLTQLARNGHRRPRSAVEGDSTEAD
jgi:putative aminopeptidase FrvX